MDRTEAGIQFDLANHVAEVLAGVARANLETGGALEVEAIEVVPDDYQRGLKWSMSRTKLPLRSSGAKPRTDRQNPAKTDHCTKHHEDEGAFMMRAS